MQLSLTRHLRARVLGIATKEADFLHRGFSGGDAPSRAHLEEVGRSFIGGYNAALNHIDPEALSRILNTVPRSFQGFAFEGAAMALTVQDLLTPWRRSRLTVFLAGIGAPHLYLGYVGAGWAAARLRTGVDGLFARLDPLLRWLVLDGYGFHEGYFHHPRYIQRAQLPRRFSGYARRAFDQGLGRSIWFVSCADVARVGEIVKGFPQGRHGDLWSGIGLGCAYAGATTMATLTALSSLAGVCLPQVAQGVAFAAKARLLAATPATHTEVACKLLCGMTVPEAASVTDAALRDLPPDGLEPAYEVWRQRIQRHFTLCGANG